MDLYFTFAFRNFPGTVQNAERKGGVRVMEIPAHTVTQTKDETPVISSRRKYEKLAVVVHVLHGHVYVNREL